MADNSNLLALINEMQKSLNVVRSTLEEAGSNDLSDIAVTVNLNSLANIADVNGIIAEQLTPTDMNFIVVGGIYSDADFETIVDLQEHGPYETYEEAQKKWGELSWGNVDNFHARWQVVPTLKEKEND